MSGLATTCPHPSAQQDVYRNNGRLFTYCRACDTDLAWALDYGSDGGQSDRFIDARCALPIAKCRICSAIAERYGNPPKNGSPTPCEKYTARSWSPGSQRPEDARCVNCNQSHGPAVGGSESRVAPGQLADEERSAPPTDLAPDIGSSQSASTGNTSPDVVVVRGEGVRKAP